MLNRTNEADDSKRKLPLTKLQKGRRYAGIALILGLSYSTYANVRSGMMGVEPVITSVAPTIVLFITVHLMSYFNPKNAFERVLVRFGLGFVALVAFGVSGFHIWQVSVTNGQHWIIALFYPVIIDIPTMLATAILVQKVSTNTAPQKTDTSPKTPQVAKTPAKRAAATKSTTPAKRTSTTKQTVTV